MTLTGRTLGENIANAEVYQDDVIRPERSSEHGRGFWPCRRFRTKSPLHRRCHLPVEGSDDGDLLGHEIGLHHATNKLTEFLSYQAVTGTYLH
jgi:hypothetical protein